MSWQDRDYARPTASGSTYLPGVSSWTTSIVNILLAVNVGIFLLVVLTGGEASPIQRYGRLEPQLVFKGQIWRLLTSQYLHRPGLLFHIIFNMISLYFMGRPLERLWGNRKFFAVYTVAGLIGGVFYVMAARVGYLPMNSNCVGASGCVLGLIGVCAVLFPTATVIVMFLPMTLRTAALLMTAFFVVNVMGKGWNYGGDLAHLGGLAFGVFWARFGETGRITLPLWLRRMRGPAIKPRRRSRSAPPNRAEVDRILAKVHDEGMASLSASEKSTLRQASEHERELDRRFGRVDRL